MATKSKDADTIMELAKNRYDRSREIYEQNNKDCVESMKKLDDTKFLVWNSFSVFLDLFERIKNRPELTGNVEKDEVKLSKPELEDIKLKSTQLRNAMAGAAVGAAAGAFGATVALGGIGLSAFLAMGVKDAIEVTVSLASVNIALYGVGAVFWPAAAIAAAATAVGALFSTVHGSKQLAEAEEVEKQVDMACRSFITANDYLYKLKKCAENAKSAIEVIYKYYSEKLEQLGRIVDRTENYLEFSDEEKKTLETTTLLVVILKKLTQTSLFIKKASDNVNVQETMIDNNYVNDKKEDKQKEEPDEINDEQLENVIASSMEQFETITADSQEKVEDIVYEDVFVGSEIGKEYDRKRIVLTKTITTASGTYIYKNCRISLENGSWNINNGDYRFENCIFESDNHKCRNINITGRSAKVVFDGCTWTECDFLHDGMLEIEGECQVEIRNCTVSGCRNTFMKATSVRKIKIDNCLFEKHCNRLFEFVTINEKNLEINNCTFDGFTGDSEYVEKASSYLLDDRDENAVIHASYTSFRIMDCLFSDLSIPLINGESLSERMDWINCSFKNIHFGEMVLGKDRKEYYSERAFNMPGGLNYIKDCEFIDVSGFNIGSIGDFLNAISQVENCSFIGCRGNISLQYTLVLNCTFSDCSSTTNLLSVTGMAGRGGRRCLSEISGCKFIKCRADNYIIMPYNAMHKKEISISVNNNTFEGCEAGQDELISLVSYFMGQPEGKIITASNNVFLDEVKSTYISDTNMTNQRGVKGKTAYHSGQTQNIGDNDDKETGISRNAEIEELTGKLEELNAKYQDVKEKIRKLQKEKNELIRKKNS